MNYTILLLGKSKKIKHAFFYVLRKLFNAKDELIVMNYEL